MEAITYLANRKRIDSHFRKEKKLLPLDIEALAAIYLLSLKMNMPKAKDIADKIGYHQDLMYAVLTKLVKKKMIEKHKSAVYNLKGTPGFGVTYVYSIHGRGYEILEQYQALTEKYKKA